MISYTLESLFGNDVCDYVIPVTEGVSLSSDDIKPGDIWVTHFPYYGTESENEYDNRPSIVMEYPNEGLRVFRLSNVISKKPGNERSKRVLNDKMNFFLKHSKDAGLKNDSVFVTPYFLTTKSCKLLTKIGSLTDDDYVECKLKVLKFAKEFTKNPYWFIGWLKGNDIVESTHPSGNNNNCKLQSLNDIIRSKSGNCVDFAYAVYTIAKSAGLDPIIARTTFMTKDGKRGSGHVYCVYREHRSYVVFRFFPISSYGWFKADLKYYKNASVFDVLNGEAEFLKDYHTQRLGTTDIVIQHKVYTDKDMSIWNNFVKSGKTQNELFAEFNKNESVSENFNLTDLEYLFDI